MIFREDYDKILLMMLKADRSNKKRIVEFLKEFPKELLLQLQEDLKDYRMVIGGEHKSGYWSFPSSEELYYYDIFYNTLSMGKEVGPSGEKDCVFELEMKNIFAYGEIDLFEEEYLGALEFEEPSVEVEYNAIKTPLGYISYALTETYEESHQIDDDPKKRVRFGLSGKRNKNVSVEQLSGPTRKRTK